MNKLVYSAVLSALSAMVATAQTIPASTTTGITTGTTTATTTTGTKATTSKKKTSKKPKTTGATTIGTTTSTTPAAPKATTTTTTSSTTTSSQSDIPAKDRIKVVKSACSQLFVQTMFDDSIPVEQKVKTVDALAMGLEKANREGVDDGVLQSALNILSTVDGAVVKNLPSYVTTVVSVCEEKGYYGSDSLRKAVRRFIAALSAR